MARARRRPSDSLIERLAKAPSSFDFVQAVRLIESEGGLDEPRAARAEDSVAPAIRARFVSESRLRFPNATLTEARLDGASLRITVSGFGLLGPVGVLPYSYTALVASSLHDKNEALKAFIDIFQHRAVTLFYGAASKYRIVINHERNLRGEPDRFSNALAHLTGLGPPPLRRRLTVADATILYFAGLFASKARTSSGLQSLLTQVLEAPVRVVPLVGRWLAVAEGEQTRMGEGGGLGRPASGQHNRLGSSAMVGARTWCVQNSFRVVVGPIDAERIGPLLPGGRDADVITDIAGLYCGLEYECDVNLIIKAASVPRARLGPADDGDGDTRLGQTSWLLAAPSPTDRDDAVFTLDQTRKAAA